jgi:molecular chaperone GrpE
MTHHDRHDNGHTNAGKDEVNGADTPAATPKGSASNRDLTDISSELHEEVLRERDEYLDSLQRLQAEFANFRKRVQRESERHAERASSEVIEELLPVLDNFERAMQAAAEHDEKLLTSGVELVYNQLRDILAKRGLCEIEAEGETFDPTHHEAVMCQPSEEHEEGTVMQVLEKGYRRGEKVVRPAKVIVSTSSGEDSDSG